MTLSRPVNDFAFIEQETIILGARKSCWFKLFELLLLYLRFSWDSLDLCELASKEVNFPCFRVSVSIRACLWLVYLLAFWAEISTI